MVWVGSGLSKTFFVGNTQLLGIVEFSLLSWQGSLGFRLMYFRVLCLPPQNMSKFEQDFGTAVVTCMQFARTQHGA